MANEAFTPDASVTIERVLQGRQLVLENNCGACHNLGTRSAIHNPEDPRWLSGRAANGPNFLIGTFKTYPRNLMPDNETGLGKISTRQIWHAAQAYAQAHHDKAGEVDKFLSELAWRDFSYHQLYHRQDIAQVPMQPKFSGVKWRHAPAQLDAWRKGLTGIPIVDAGMRELWATGWMHNRVRMIVGSFLTKDLRSSWQVGATWFWDTLVDADLANNTLGWQWVSGCGADAAPYFRVFNPVLQGKKFDPGGEYVRRWVPQLDRLPERWLHEPWNAPAKVLEEAGVVPGATYPLPVVEHGEARSAALEAFKSIR